MTSRIPEPDSPLEEEGIPDLSDALPQKVVTGDTQEELPPPRDYPVAVEDYGTTAAEMHEGEPLDLRLSREQPDVGAGDVVTGAVSPDTDGGIGRLVADSDDGAFAQEDGYATDAGADGGGLAPEERAMHEESPPA